MLAILAVVTTLAIRALDDVEDQRRFEATQRGLEELEFAILGSPDDRAADGSRTVSGFVADMGRLPKSVGETLQINGSALDTVTLRELWQEPPPLQMFALRHANKANTIPATAADPDVRVPGGWRGPYIRLPLGSETLFDGWGNGYISPRSGSAPTARLLTYGGLPLTVVNQPIVGIRHLGADGVEGGSGYNKDHPISFTYSTFTASIWGRVEAAGDSIPPTDTMIVRVFCPHREDVTKISVFESDPVPASDPVLYTIVTAPGDLTIGPRVARAYRYQIGSTTPSHVSSVKTVTLRRGGNQLNLTIDRPWTPPTQ